jgi:hypothetical protein
VKKFIFGLVLGGIIITTSWVIAYNPITIIVNGKTLNPEVPAQIINGRTMVPLRAIVESLDLNIEWINSTNTIIITNKNKSRDDTEANTRTNEPMSKIAYIGDLINLNNADIKIFSLEYGKNFNEFSAGEGRTFAILHIEIFPKTPPKNQAYWSANSFVGNWYINNGEKEIAQCFTTGESTLVEEGRWNYSDVLTEIILTDRITAVEVLDPISRDTYTVHLEK